MAIRQTSDSVVMSCDDDDEDDDQSRSCPFSSFPKRGECVFINNKRERKRRVAQAPSTVLDEYESILNQSPMLVKVTDIIRDLVSQTS